MKFRYDEENDIFYGIYIYFAALKEGFLPYCNSYTSKSTLSSIMEIDPNNQIYPFVYATFERKNNNA